MSYTDKILRAEAMPDRERMLESRGIALEADAEIAALKAANLRMVVDELGRVHGEIAALRARAERAEAELERVVEWARVEKAPLRQREIDSINRVLAAARAA